MLTIGKYYNNGEISCQFFCLGPAEDGKPFNMPKTLNFKYCNDFPRDNVHSN